MHKNEKLDVSIWSEISLLCNVDFLLDDGSIDQQLPSLCDEIVGMNYQHFGEYFKQIHIAFCLIPEGIIRLIMEKYAMSFSSAERLYLTRKVSSLQLEWFRDEEEEDRKKDLLKQQEARRERKERERKRRVERETQAHQLLSSIEEVDLPDLEDLRDDGSNKAIAHFYAPSLITTDKVSKVRNVFHIRS